MNSTVEWHLEFARVISCNDCTRTTDQNLLRDENKNVPQPGYIGPHYDKSRVLLVSRNPGMLTEKLATLHDQYTTALHALRNGPTPQRYGELNDVLSDLIPQSPICANYFALRESGLAVEDIAYCNIVRCRTSGNAQPGKCLTQRCLKEHFERWLDLLAPRVVVFIGKWVWEQASSIVESKCIPCDFINCRKDLSRRERAENRAQVGAFVKRHRA